MIYLLLCILSSSLLMVIFKIVGRRKLDNYFVIVINYFVASIFGFSIGGFPSTAIFSAAWLPFAGIIGVLFILIFLVMALSTQRSGISSTTIASKMSVILPISFSIFYFHETVSSLKIFGIVLALLAVFLTIYKKDRANNGIKSNILLPLTLFIGSGVIDSLIKYTQESFLESTDTITFTSTLFLIAALSGIVYLPFSGKSLRRGLNKEVIIAGIILGIINFGSLFGIVTALESRVFDSSIIFGINNIGIVLLSVIIALVAFSEKLSFLNKIGIFLSIVSIIVLSVVK